LISLDCCSLLQLSEPQPAVENRSEITEFTNSSFGSRLPQSKEEVLALRGLSFYRGDKKKRATLPSSSL
jgi:hypothetical protein